MAQDYYDPLQPFDYIVDLLDDHKADLGVAYIAQLDEDIIPQYPAIIVNMDGSVQREQHATQQFLIQFNVYLFILHHELSSSMAARSRKDIELATDVRKLLHSKSTMDGHIIFGFVIGEYPGRSIRVVENVATSIVSTRLHWQGQNRVPYSQS